jgi:hypothetical protein
LIGWIGFCGFFLQKSTESNPSNKSMFRQM